MKTGLVLEGGGMRGMFTCGVIDVFMENDITFDCGVGVSAGAIFGCNIKSKQIGRPIRYNKQYCADPRYSSIRSLLRTGNLFNEDFCYRELPDELDVWDTKTFAENPMDFYVCVTNIETGKSRYHRCTDGGREDIRWMQASASMPLVAKPVEIGGYRYLDGGIVDSVPLRFAESICDRTVVVLTQPADYRKKKNSLLPLLRIAYGPYPRLVEALEQRHICYNQQVEYVRQREQEGGAFVICPPVALGIDRTSKKPDELERVYQIGRETATASLPALREFLAS